MWITTITYDLVKIRDDIDRLSMIDAIKEKINQLAVVDGNGNLLPGFEIKDSSFYQELTTTELKRTWNTQAAADEFVNFANLYTEFITASVEEQV